MPRAASNDLVVLNLIPDKQGWQPITHLVRLIAEIFDARVICPGDIRSNSLLPRSNHRIFNRKRVEGAPSLLIVASKADGIKQIGSLPDWRNAYGTAAAWIIDSFHSENLSPGNGFRHLDQVFVTWGGNIPEYQKVTAAPVTWLPWGTDALRLGHMEPARCWDLLRFGRQPESWEDDQVNAERLAAHGLSFQGRPQEDSYQGLLRKYLAHTRYVLAHSNLADGSGYTHASREYITARWTDAFACGAGVIGVQPRSDPLFGRVLPEAVVDLETTDRETELPRIRREIAGWTPEKATRIRNMALRDFDWRWRLRDMARAMGLGTERLDSEIAEIESLLPADRRASHPEQGAECLENTQ